MTKEEILEKLKDNPHYASGEFEVCNLTDAAIPGTQFICKCNICGHEWNAFLHNLLYLKTGCPRWQKHEKLQYQVMPKTRLSENIVWLNPEINSYKDLYEFECKQHGKFNLTYSAIQAIVNRNQVIKCPICRSIDIFNKRIKNNPHIKNGDIWLAKEWNGYDQIVECVCKKHGTFLIDRTNLGRGRGCQKCSYENSASSKHGAENRQQIIKLFEENPSASYEKIAEILGMTPQNVKHHAKKAGIVFKGRRDEKREKFLNLYYEHPDWTAAELAEKLGITVEAVMSRAKKEGIQIRRK